MTPSPQSGPARVAIDPAEDVHDGSTDNELLAAIAVDDRRAFAILMRRHLSSMVRLANRIVFDFEQAREIAQEAFLRVWRHAAQWDPDGTATFTTWLRRVTVNLAISQKRRRREQTTLEAAENVPDDSADGFDQVASADQRRTVRESLEALPTRQRAAISLYYYENASQIEAAEILQMTPRAFDSLIVRARQNLKKQLTARGVSREEI